MWIAAGKADFYLKRGSHNVLPCPSSSAQVSGPLQEVSRKFGETVSFGSYPVRTRVWCV